MDDTWPELINAAAGYRVRPFSKEYAVACLRLQEWRKNWWSRLMYDAKYMQSRLMLENRWENLPESNLIEVTKIPIILFDYF